LSVAVAIDTSAATGDPTHADINSNGVVGEVRGGGAPIFGGELTDQGDSVLSATVVAVRSMIRGVANHERRFAVVSFSGQSEGDLPPQMRGRKRSRPDAILQTGLTGDVSQLEKSLSRILESGSEGVTKFAPAMQLAVEALREGDAGGTPGRKLVLFISDSPTPILGQRNRKLIRVEPEIQTVALAAIEEKVLIHTFGVSTAANAATPHTLSRIAGATSGRYRPVSDMMALACMLVESLSP
jgi:hypothetical protein